MGWDNFRPDMGLPRPGPAIFWSLAGRISEFVDLRSAEGSGVMMVMIVMFIIVMMMMMMIIMFIMMTV